MAAILKIVLVIAVAVALSMTLTMKSIGNVDQNINNSSTLPKEPAISNEEVKLLLPSKRLSRFLANKDPNRRAADHCHKNPEICGTNSTCCNNKCMDLWSDEHNCGECKNKCLLTQNCCRGECVYLDYDKRHCGKCNNPCMQGEYCVYGMCGYA